MRWQSGNRLSPLFFTFIPNEQLYFTYDSKKIVKQYYFR